MPLSRVILPRYSAAEDNSIKVLIVAGAGKHFSVGHDIGSPQAREDPDRRLYSLYRASTGEADTTSMARGIPRGSRMACMIFTCGKSGR